MSYHWERLTSSLVDGLWHAHYPTGLRTLCGLPAPANPRGRRYRPTCAICSQLARRFHAIDQSCPPHWRVRLTRAERERELDQVAA